MAHSAPAADTWFITGASSGIGRELTRLLLERGRRVAATDLDAHLLADLAASAGDRLWTSDLDVTQLDQIERAVAQAWATFGQIDVVVNNAGYGLVGAGPAPKTHDPPRQGRRARTFLEDVRM